MTTKKPPFPKAPGTPTGGRKLLRRGPSPMALEQRFMFDGAGAVDALSVIAAEPLFSPEATRAAQTGDDREAGLSTSGAGEAPTQLVSVGESPTGP